MALSPLELGLGLPMPVSEVGVLTSSSGLITNVDAKTGLPLRLVGNSVDLDIDLSLLDEHNRYGKSYEEDCFRRVGETLGPNEVAYGPHLLNSAFATLKQNYLSVPDALVGRLDYSSLVLDPSGVPLDSKRPVIRIVRIIEARTGKINGNLKLAGFRNLTAEISKDPQGFALAINRFLQGRGGFVNPTLLFAPPDGEIDIVFYSPKPGPSREDAEETEDEMRQRHLAENPFRSVTYKYLPLPEKTERTS